MFMSNPFSELSELISPAVMQGYIILMVLLVIGGTLLVLRQPPVVGREVTPTGTDPGAGAGTPTSP